MAVTGVGARLPENMGPEKSHGALVQVRLRRDFMGQELTNEAWSAPLIRNIWRHVTIWVEGEALSDRFMLEMCYMPVFTQSGDMLTLDVVNSKWARFGNIIQLQTLKGLVASQTFDDLGYAFRVVRVNAAGVPTAGNFKVYVWYVSG